MANDIEKYRRRSRRTLRITLAWVLAGMVAAVLENNVLTANGLHQPLIDLAVLVRRADRRRHLHLPPA